MSRLCCLLLCSLLSKPLWAQEEPEEPEQATEISEELPASTPTSKPIQPSTAPSQDLLRWKDISFRPYLEIQNQAAVFVGNDTFLEEDSVAIEEGYRVRRARAGVSGSLAKDIGYLLSIDIRDETLPDSAGLNARPRGAQLLDAQIRLETYKAAMLTFGSSPVPFSRGGMTEGVTSTFLQEPFGISRLSPDRRVGVSLSGKGLVSYYLGSYNASDSLTFGSLGGGLLNVARIELAPLGPVDPFQSGLRTFQGTRLSLGASGYLASGETQNTLAGSVDLFLQAGPVTALVEGIFSQIRAVAAPNLPGGAEDNTSRLSIYAQLGAMVLPKKLEVAGRVEFFDDNLSLADEGDLLGVTLGIKWLSYEGRLRSGFEFSKRIERQGQDFSNDLALFSLGVRL